MLPEASLIVENGRPKIVYRRGVNGRPKLIPDEELRRLMAAGMKQAAIAKRFKVTAGAVRRACRRLRIPPRRKS